MSICKKYFKYHESNYKGQPMNQEVKARWIEALKSGSYEKGIGKMNANNQFCCLGVLCDIHAKEFGNEWLSNDLFTAKQYLGSTHVLPWQVIEWAGLEDGNSNPEAGELALAEHNDGTAEGEDEIREPKTFVEIADLINQYL